MRILWLNPNLLVPLDKGGKLRTWHLLRQLAPRHDITYVCFAPPAARPEHLEAMHQVCARLVAMPREDPPKGTPRFWLHAARFLLDPLPYAVAKYRSRRFARAVAEILRVERPDVVVCDFLPPLVNLPRGPLPAPMVLFTHNVEAEIWRRHALNAAGPRRALLRGQWRRMQAFESAALARADLVLAVSDADRETFARLYPGRAPRCLVVPTGVDTTYFRPPVALDADPHRLVFTGSMDWLPNEDAMLYCCREILPVIRRREPGVSLQIVGRDPTPAVRRLAREPGVEVTGTVDDIRPYLARAGAVVVPLRIAGGTRLKIFEAMAMGRPVVATTVGAEGLPVADGRDILIADDPERFAAAVVRLVRDDAERRRIGLAARRLVESRYDWAVVARALEEAVTAVARAASPRPAAISGSGAVAQAGAAASGGSPASRQASSPPNRFAAAAVEEPS
ncbi:MAG TPA: glycosyltransferase [Vicinamibacterales bacterium]|nr:glycosyltransferase [Vicinamibacterales bacterium]